MLAGYSNNINPVAELASVAGLMAFRTEKGKFVVTTPLDYVVWTADSMGIFEALDAHSSTLTGISGKEFWLTGSVSPKAREMITAKGWNVMEQCGEKLTP